MIKPRYILLLTLVLAAIILFYFYKVNARPSPVLEEKTTETIEKVYTKIDTSIFNFDRLFTQMLDSSGTVGAAVVITYKGEIVFMKCFGVKESGKKDPIDRNTVFRLASVSKTFTGVLAGILSEEKIIGLDDRVNNYLPGFKLKDSINTYNLSISHILSHTSGLVPHAYDNLAEAGVSFPVIMDSLWRVNISAPPGKLYGYQNVVFSLIDTILAVKTGKSYGELLEEKMFEPFGMMDASTGFQPFEENENKAYPHYRSKSKYKVLPLNNRYYNTNPAAGINASISDMSQFLLALSENDSPKVSQYVVNEVFRPHIITPLRWNYLKNWNGVESKDYGLGWRIIGFRGRTIAYHGGYVQGYRAEIALCREEGLGIAYLTNSPNWVGSVSVPLFLDMFLE